jgi:hypothetical protein
LQRGSLSRFVWENVQCGSGDHSNSFKLIDTGRRAGPNSDRLIETAMTRCHWLELPAKTTAGQFATVSLIRRVDTTGGLLPDGKPCDAQHAGDQERVGYSATYLFYTTK